MTLPVLIVKIIVRVAGHSLVGLSCGVMRWLGNGLASALVVERVRYDRDLILLFKLEVLAELLRLLIHALVAYNFEIKNGQ